MEIKELELPGVKLILPTYFEDYRGYNRSFSVGDALRILFCSFVRWAVSVSSSH